MHLAEFVCFTDDVVGTCQTLVGRGLELAREPVDYDRGRSAYLRDPDGNLLEPTES